MFGEELPECNCEAKVGELHRETCAVKQAIDRPQAFTFPTVAGICGTHGHRDCPLCTTVPHYEDAPEFWGQVIGD